MSRVMASGSAWLTLSLSDSNSSRSARSGLAA